MTPLDIVLVAFGLCGVIIIVLIILIFIQKGLHATRKRRVLSAQHHIDKTYHHETDGSTSQKSDFILRQFMALQDQIVLDTPDQIAIINDLKLDKQIKKLHRQAKHWIPQRRLIAYYKLTTLISLNQRDFFLKRLGKEKRENIKFIIVYALLDIMDVEIFDVVMNSLEHSSEDYQKRIATILNNHYNVVAPFVEPYLDSESQVILLCILRLSIKNGNKSFSNYIIDSVDDYISQYENNDTVHHSVNIEIVHTCLQYMLTYHSQILLHEPLFQRQENDIVLRYVVEAHAKTNNLQSLQTLFRFCETMPYDEYYSTVLSKMINEEQLFLLYIIQEYHTLNHPVLRKYITRVLSNKMGYILLKVLNSDTKNIASIIKDVLQEGYISPIIEFLNQNNKSNIEVALIKLIEPLVLTQENIKEEFRLYLDEAILLKLGLSRLVPTRPPKAPPKLERSKIIWVLSVVAFTFLLFPGLFIIRRFDALSTNTFKQLITMFVVDVNIYLITYYVFANVIYIVLTILSFYGAKKQLRLWDIKSDSLLFEENLLPSISVLAPAYNEEMSIIESVNSLMNLTYPNYEIIVINDGSSDRTLQTVVNHFQLKRRDYHVNNQLNAKPIRGIYTNKEHPNLIVVDKANGGKADALNVGINVSSKQYICGIDSDSVLDTDSLLRLSAVTLDEQHPIIAFGGNIVPANGCVIKRGKIEERGFPKETIPRFQSLEYLRAFTTGRVGWSQMNSLLIISGAFGMFKRDNVIRIGGYITSSGVLQKDSVGEDMELVVRLTYNALQQKQKYYVKYIFHANCYTELPSDTKTLLRQRNRWHRGLVDILSYYRRLFMNPRYKQIGLLVLPYFYIFEVIGPLFEVVGYTMLIVGLILGILSPAILLGVFLVSVWFGIVISLSSLYIAEFDESSFSKKDIVLLILFGILENFGYRQVLSFHRAYSLFTALKESGKWGEQKRKGISAKS